MKRALVCGSNGFIGSNLIKKLKKEGYWVKAIDIKESEFEINDADELKIFDLRNQIECEKEINFPFDEVYQLAADMGGANYVFTHDHDSEILYNNQIINLNVLNCCQKSGVKKLFFSSSACVYPLRNQLDPNNPICSEDSVYPAFPDNEYGWEKLFSERVYSSFRKLGMKIYIARFHNTYGNFSAWKGGREKAPAAICRKIIESDREIEIFGGKQTRSFLHINDCLDAIRLLVNSEDFFGPVNIGSEELVSINELSQKLIKISGKKLSVKNIDGPIGVNGRNSDNKLIKEKLGWEPKIKLEDGLRGFYNWINFQIEKENLLEKSENFEPNIVTKNE